MEHYQLSVNELQISINDIEELAHLEQGMPSYGNFLQGELELLNQTTSVTGGYTLINATVESGDIKLEDVTFRAGLEVTKFLKGMEQAAIFLCTAGQAVTERSKQLTLQGDLVEGYLVDLLGSVMVEKAMDKIADRLRLDMMRLGLKTTNRYSPGYCQWDVAEQTRLFTFLPDNFCGVTLTDSCLMVPTKTISGIIGIGRNVKYHKHVCHLCNSTNCLYRKTKKSK